MGSLKKCFFDINIVARIKDIDLLTFPIDKLQYL
jgi:hypothetical protein